MTEEMFRADAYTGPCEARGTWLDTQDWLDRTVFYPLGGGQPGDSGEIVFDGGTALRIADTRKGATGGDIVHVPDGPVDAGIVGPRRARMMGAAASAHAHAYLPAPAVLAVGRRSPAAPSAMEAGGSTSIFPRARSTSRTSPRV